MNEKKVRIYIRNLKYMSGIITNLVGLNQENQVANCWIPRACFVLHCGRTGDGLLMSPQEHEISKRNPKGQTFTEKRSKLVPR
jgi:hypothetical protein